MYIYCLEKINNHLMRKFNTLIKNVNGKVGKLCVKIVMNYANLLCFRTKRVKITIRKKAKTNSAE